MNCWFEVDSKCNSNRFANIAVVFVFQLFAIQLASYLCLQFPLPKAMGVARYILSRLSSLLATLPASKRAAFFTPTLPTLVRFCRAFPPLCDEAIGFLLELGRVAASHASASAGFTLGMYH